VQLETKVAELRTESELTLAQRIGPLQEQLRAHAQTVGILVGEKTELEAALAHHIATAEQRTSTRKNSAFSFHLDPEKLTANIGPIRVAL